ncbi:MAG: hypothetical protein R2877_06090 [Bdellovibrionota bacterium]
MRTVGDIESLPFLEAIRQFRGELGRDNTLYIHLTLVPYIRTAGEVKPNLDTAFRQGASANRNSTDILLCRTEVALTSKLKEKSDCSATCSKMR